MRVLCVVSNDEAARRIGVQAKSTSKTSFDRDYVRENLEDSSVVDSHSGGRSYPHHSWVDLLRRTQ